MNKLLGALSRLSILRFAVIGALGMPVDWAVLQLMVHWGTGPYAGRLISWFCAASFTWTGNRYFTFAASRARGLLAPPGNGCVSWPPMRWADWSMSGFIPCWCALRRRPSMT